MLTLNGLNYDKFRETDRLGLLFSSPDYVLKDKMEHFKLIDNYLIMVTGNNKMIARDYTGMGEVVAEITVSAGIKEMVVDSDRLILIYNKETHYYPVSISPFSFGAKQVITNSMDLSNANIFPKVKNNIVYFEFFQYVLTFNMNTKKWQTVHTAPYFISNVELLNDDGTKMLRNLEVKQTNNISYVSGSTTIDNTLPSTYFEKVKYLHTLDEILTDDGKTIYYASFNGHFFKATLGSDGKLTNHSLIFTVKGTVEKILLHKDYIIVMHDMNDITLWNRFNEEMEYIYLKNRPINIEVNNFFLVCHVDKYSYNIYKLINLPELSIDYSLLEKVELLNNKFLYMLNTHVSLNFEKYRYLNYGEQYTVNLKYRKRPNTATWDFPEPNQSANMYMDFNDTELMLKELSFKLDDDKLYYEIINSSLGLIMTNEGTKLRPDEIIYKVYAKDMYHLNDSIYFRLRLVIEDNYSLKIKVDGKEILINNGIDEINNSFKYHPEKTYEYRYQRSKDFETNMAHKFSWFKIPDIDFSETKTLEMTLYRKGIKKDEYSLTVDNVKRNHQMIEYTTIDGELHVREKEYLSELEDGEKTLYLEHMSTIASENILNNSNIKVNKEAYIAQSQVNDESQFGYLDLSLPYDSFQEKQYSLIGDIYIDGRHIFRRRITQRDHLNGNLFIFLPTRFVSEVIDSKSDVTSIESGKTIPSKYKIVTTTTRRKLVESEEFIYDHKIDNTYEDQTSILQTIGLSMPANIPHNTRINELRVYIMKDYENVYRRLNPQSYSMEVDREYGYLKLTIPSAAIATEGTIIRVVTNGSTDNRLFFSNLKANSYDLESLPYIETDRYGEMYTNTVQKAEDLDINLNGMTLYPNIDYKIIDPANIPNVPTLIIFRNVIPKDNTIIEISKINSLGNFTFYWKRPAEGTDNYFSMNDDRLLFIKGTFSLYVNNYRIDKSQYSIVNTKTIKINGFSKDKLINVMVRFTYLDHVNLQLILDNYKYKNIDRLDKYYHSFLQVQSPSRFDEYCNNQKSSSVDKILIQNEINSENFSIFNCNYADDLDWDLIIDTSEIKSQYITANIDLNSNPIKRKSLDVDNIKNPKI